MADKEKKVARNSEVEKATTEESKAAEKVAKAAKGSKKDKPNFFARAGKSTKRFFKDFKGETKKIVWPDARTVLKNTGIVLVVVTLVTAVIFAIDFGLETGIVALKEAAISAGTNNDADANANAVNTNTDASEEDTTTEADETEETTSDEEETTVAASEDDTQKDEKAE